jgi:S1-C subfamily serine protease
MARSVAAIIVLLFASAALAQAPLSQPAAGQTSVPCAVSVVHTIDVQKMIETMREQQKLRVGVAGTAPPFIYSITTGIIVDDQGHVVTRLVNLDPQNKEHRLSVTTSDGRMLTARLIGVDFATGFAVLDVAALKSTSPKISVQTNLTNGAPVKILSSDVVQKSVDDKVYLAPSITISQGQVLVDSLYPKARGALTLQSASLLARRDGSVVVTPDNQVVGIAQYAGFGRAYLYPIEYVRNIIAKRVIERKDNVPAGWLGVRGDSVAELPDADFRALGMPKRAGVIIRLVPPESAAAEAGILVGDVITGVDDFDVAGTADLRAFLSQFPAGQTVKLRAVRDHKPVEITAILGARPNAEIQDWSALLSQGLHPEISQRDQLQKRYDELVARYREYQSEFKKTPQTTESREAINELTIEIRHLQDLLRTLPPENTSPSTTLATAPAYPTPNFTGASDVTFPAGFTARELTKQLADNFQTHGGVLVTTVAAGSPAEKAGLKAGDVIVGTQERVLLHIAQLQAILSSQRGTITLRVIRTKEPIAVSLLIQ